MAPWVRRRSEKAMLAAVIISLHGDGDEPGTGPRRKLGRERDAGPAGVDVADRHGRSPRAWWTDPSVEPPAVWVSPNPVQGGELLGEEPSRLLQHPVHHLGVGVLEAGVRLGRPGPRCSPARSACRPGSRVVGHAKNGRALVPGRERVARASGRREAGCPGPPRRSARPPRSPPRAERQQAGAGHDLVARAREGHEVTSWKRRPTEHRRGQLGGPVAGGPRSISASRLPLATCQQQTSGLSGDGAGPGGGAPDSSAHSGEASVTPKPRPRMAGSDQRRPGGLDRPRPVPARPRWSGPSLQATNTAPRGGARAAGPCLRRRPGRRGPGLTATAWSSSPCHAGPTGWWLRQGVEHRATKSTAE